MSYLKAIAQALESQRYRYLPGGDKGIARAILNRDEPAAEDWEFLIKITQTALKKELDIHLDGIEQDLADIRRAKELAETITSEALRARLSSLRSQHVGPEISDSGTRHTAKAVANQGARDGFRERMVIEMALELQGESYEQV